MDIRDGTTRLTNDDVSILYFERHGAGAKIHSLNLDEQGNIDAPPSYGKFFMEAPTLAVAEFAFAQETVDSRGSCVSWAIRLGRRPIAQWCRLRPV